MSINTDIDGALWDCIELVGREFEWPCVVRPIAASIGIAQGIMDPDDLYAYCERLVSSDVVQEGYEEEHYVEHVPELNSKSFLGQGVSIPSFEAYLTLYSYFSDNWLNEALLMYAIQQTPGVTHSQAAKQAEEKVHRAKERYLTVSGEHYRWQEAALDKKRSKAWQRFVDAMKIVAPDGVQFGNA